MQFYLYTLKILTVFLFFIACIRPGYSQSGRLDPSFGKNGIVTTDMDSLYDYFSYSSQVLIGPDSKMYIVVSGAGGNVVSRRLANGAIDSSYGLNGYSNHIGFSEAFGAFQPDGKIVFAGTNGSYYNGVKRTNADGSQDSGFGENGLRSTNFFTNSVTVQNDGKIIVVGAGGGAGDGFSVARYNSDGTVDSSFGGTGQVKTGFAYKIPPDRGGEDSTLVYGGIPYAVKVQANGKIVVGGTGGKEDYGVVFAIARYNIDGSLDSTFDDDGLQTTLIGDGGDIGYALVIQDDGKIVMGGVGYLGGQSHFVIARYNYDGALDNSFNGSGKLVAGDFNSDYQARSSLVVQNDRKIVIGGYALNGGSNNFVTARFNLDGTPDNTFGLSGIVYTHVESSDDFAASLAVEGNKIVAAGYTLILDKPVFAVIRYNNSGSLDSSFDAEGILLGNFRQGSTQFNAAVFQPDGKLVVVGRSWNGTNDDFAILRYTNHGVLDSTFSADGKQTIDFGAFDEANGVAIQSDGKIVVTGNSDNRNYLSLFVVARYNPDGTLDNTFNSSGWLATPVLYGGISTGLALQPDDKIVVVGGAYSAPDIDSTSFAILRFDTDGTPDTSFNGDGVQIINFDSFFSTANAVTIQPNGSIIVLGRSYVDQQNYFSLARLKLDGNLDTSFSGDGKHLSVFGTENYFSTSIVLQGDGKILVAGSSQEGSSADTWLVLARFKDNGELDSTFNQTGFRRTQLGFSFSYANSVAIKDDGRIAVGGTNDNFALVLYKQDGTPDSSFAENGTKITQVGLSTSSIKDIAFWQNNLYAVGSAQYPGNLATIASYIIDAQAVSFITRANGAWNDPATWIDGMVPNASSAVIVQHAVTISGEAMCYSLTVTGPDGVVTVLSGAHLTITH